MKQKIKNDATLAENMWWSLILSFAAALSVLRLYTPEVSMQIVKDVPPMTKIAIMISFLILSALLLVRFFVYMAKRKKNKRAIENIMETGIKVVGKVEDVLQKGISVKYILKVSYKDPQSYEDVTAFTPLLHKDPRHYTAVGNNIDVYVDPDDAKNFYIDVKDE